MTDRAGVWALRLLALAIALALWFSVSGQKVEPQSEKTVEASVTYDRAPKLVILDPVRRVEVRLRGASRRIRTLNPFEVDVVVDLTNAQAGTLDIQLTEDNVFRPEGLEVVSIEPNLLKMHLDREMDMILPVEAQLIGEPAAGATVGEPVVTPATVRVRGPETILEGTERLSTSPIRLDGHALTYEEQALVVSPDPLVTVEPSSVSVRIPMQPPLPSNGGAGGN